MMSTQFDEPCCSKNVLQQELDTQLAKTILIYFKPLEELLKCHICFEYFNTCMITKCCHSFCSLCIRKYMTYKTQCPECFQEATEPELRINRQIDGIVQIYCKIKSYLQSFGQGESPLPSDFLECVYNNASSLQCDTSSFKNDKVPRESNFGALAQNDHDAPHAQNKPRDVESINVNMDKVCCPVCSVMVLPEKINFHLDRCLLQNEEQQQQQPVSSNASGKRKPLSKVVYHLLTDKEIKKRLRENGLSSSGNRQALIKRHRNFLLLYNSECDKQNPRPVSEILKQVEMEENEVSVIETCKLFQTSKKSCPSVIQEENEKYIEQHRDQFDQLVDDIRQRQRPRRRISDCVIMDEDSGNRSEISETASSSATNEILDIITDSPLEFHSPDLFISEEHSKESTSTDLLLGENEELECDTSPLSSTSGDDYIATRSENQAKRKLKRKITGGSASSKQR